MLFPDSIPCAISTLAAPPAPVPGNGWTIKIVSHTDYHTLIAELPRYNSASFAKMLDDKGSGTITLNMDDPALWPSDPAPSSLGPDPYFSSGTLAGWQAAGGTAAVVTSMPAGAMQAGTPLARYAARLTPSGTAAQSVLEAAASIPVTPGQGYTVGAAVYSAAGYASVVTGFTWLDGNGNPLPATSATTPAAAGTWTTATASLYAPPDAARAIPFIGEAATPAAGAVLIIRAPVVSYDSGNVALGDYLLDYEHLWQVWSEGVLVFDFLGETITEQQVDNSEQRIATVTGPGTVAVLGWAAAMPPGFPDIIFKTDAIQDGFAEVDQWGNPLLDTSIWNTCSGLIWPYPSDGTTGNAQDPNSVDPATGQTYGNEADGQIPALITLNPSGTCQITASPSTTFLGASTYDITNSVISAQISPMNGTGLDGSQVTAFYLQSTSNSGNYAMIALSGTEFYCQLGDTVAGKTQTKLLGDYDPSGDLYWQITEEDGLFYFWTSADGQSWVNQWAVAYQWDATSVSLFITATYDEANSQTVSVTNLNSDVVTPTSAGNIYIGEPIMSIWYQLLQAAQSRGTIPFVTTLLNEESDTFGNLWPDSVSIQVQLGTDLYSLLQNYAAMVDADFRMQPGFGLQVGMTMPGGVVSLGNDLSAAIVFRESDTQVTKQRTRARDQVANLYGAVNSDGTVVSGSDAASIARYGQREAWVQTAEQVNPQSMDIVVGASVDQTKDEVLSLVLSVKPATPGKTALHDYDVGDWVGLERPGPGGMGVDAVRVIGIAINIDATGLVTCELTLNSYRQWLQEQMLYLINKYGGQFINSLGTTPVTSTSSNPTGLPVVVAPSLGGLSGVSIS